MGFTSIDALFLIGMVAVMWFLIIQPKRREQQALTRMLSALKKGDKVVTNSGMLGEVAAIKDPYITLRFHDNVRIDFDRAAIARVVKDEAAAPQESKATQEAKA
jgi:preprotein translocase subunit YajC